MRIHSHFLFKKINKFRLTDFLSFFSTGLRTVTILLITFLLSNFLVYCSGSKRFTSEENFYREEFKPESNSVRVLLDEKPAALYITLQNKVYLLNEKKKIAEINKGNTLECYNQSDLLSIKIGRKNFSGKYFQLIPTEGKSIKYNGRSYKGSLRIVSSGTTVELINFVDLENYLKGVIAKEMPLGNGNDNYEALKAFVICARTYALMKTEEGKLLFDIFPDTRDQVYAGESAEQIISNRAVEETSGTILLYKDSPAKVYYHSTCGGVNENVENVFPQEPVPYLISIIDGDEPFCKISPRFEWEESYTEHQFIEKLFNANLINNTDYKLDDVSISRRFPSGRVDDIKILLTGNEGLKEIHLYGNEIRTKIKTPEKDLSLWSTLFDVEEGSGKNITIRGRGFGHGVGLCQWGAIGQSKQGITYDQILEHYFPGTVLGRIND